MYKIELYSGIIHTPDGVPLNPPYKGSLYDQYLAWIALGNKPIELDDSTVAIDVTPFQAKEALARAGLLDRVNEILNSLDTDPSILRKWQETLVFRSTDAFVIKLAAMIPVTHTQLLGLFKVAKFID